MCGGWAGGKGGGINVIIMHLMLEHRYMFESQRMMVCIMIIAVVIAS